MVFTLAAAEAAGPVFVPPAALNTNAAGDSGEDSSAQVTTDGAGNWVVVWDSNDSLGGIGTDFDILVARSTDDGATWTAPAALNTNAATDSGDDFVGTGPVTTDGAGNWIAVWTSDDSLGGTIGTDFDNLVSLGADGSVGGLEGTVAALPSDAFSSTGPGQQTAVLARIDGIQQDIDDGFIDEAIEQLESLLRRVDGCADATGTAERNDWITDCAEQVRVRAFINALIASLNT
jgi:hypothetical protein